MVFIIFTISAYPVSANVVITGTRVIYPAGQHNVNVQLTNVGISPSLIQAWIDNGDPKAAPETIKTPFVITPPIARIDGNKGQTLRLSYTGEPLPADRESVFYLNVLDIPPNPRDKNKNYLQIAIRSRIKIFFRPEKIKIKLSEAYENVKWSTRGNQLIVDNPTPYFITYSHLEIVNDRSRYNLPHTGMVAPFSQMSFPLQKPIKAGTKVNWVVIDDNGARPSGTVLLQ
ncbi:molecular chaperone [Escherichia coli]|nr:molecular chaperone [Escherichia coli]HEN6918744.1 molecular chaperone [Escherichia coli]